MSIDNFDNIIKNKFDNFSETPPDYVFNNVKSDFSKIKYSNTAKFIKIASFIGATAVVSTIILLNIFNNEPTKNTKPNNTEKTILVKETNNNLNNNSNNTKTILTETQNINNNNTKENNEITINKTIEGKTFDIKLKNTKIVSSSDDLIISKDNSNFYFKTNNYGVQKICIKNSDKTINYIINFVKPKDSNNLIANNNKNTESINNNETKSTKSDFEALFVVKSPTCYNSNGYIYTVLNNNDNYTFVWNDNSKEQNRRNIKSGKYSVTITNNDNISKNYSITVNDSGIVKAALMHEELTLQINYPIYFVNKTTIDEKNIKSLNNYTVFWNFGDGTTSTDVNPEHTYTNPGNYKITLKVTGKEGCSDSVIYNDIIIPKTIVNIPNAFTPNGDGINDIFKLDVKSVKDFECIILDKSGKQIYKWTNPQEGWDGKINGTNLANDGIYYYVAKGKDSNNKPFEKTGFFYLFKNK